MRIMKTKRVVIVTNGTVSESCLSEIASFDMIIGVDRAAYWLLMHGITPHMAVGDFDSTNKTEFLYIQQHIADVRTFPAEKDFIDTELAIRIAIEEHPSEIILFGGVGTRMDHTLGTLSLLELGQRQHIPIYMKNETNEIQLIHRCRTIVGRRGEFKYISIIPYSKTISVSLEGLKYPLSHATIVRGQTIGISNEFIYKSATVTLHAGTAILIQSTD